jgi:hypothetical protein
VISAFLHPPSAPVSGWFDHEPPDLSGGGSFSARSRCVPDLPVKKAPDISGNKTLERHFGGDKRLVIDITSAT